MGQFTKQKAPKAGGHQDEGLTPGRSPHEDQCEKIIPWASGSGSLQLLSDAPPTHRWAGPRAGRAADWSQPARPLTSRRRELHPPPAFSSSPLPPSACQSTPIPPASPALFWAQASDPCQHPQPGPSPFPHFLNGRHHLLDVVLGPAAGLGPDRPA